MKPMFRPAQRWIPPTNQMDFSSIHVQPIPAYQNAHLTGYNIYEHSYNNLAFNSNLTLNNPPMVPVTSNIPSHAPQSNDLPVEPVPIPHLPLGRLGPVISPTMRKPGQVPIIREQSPLVSIKSKLEVEYRRYAVSRDDIIEFEDFYKIIESKHLLGGTVFNIYYTDQDGDVLPINNDNNLAKAIKAASCLTTTNYIVLNSDNDDTHFQQQQLYQVAKERPYLKLILRKRGFPGGLPDFDLVRKRKDNFMNMFMTPSSSSSDGKLLISMPEDFRQVSSIIDADKLPFSRRRVVLKRGNSDKPLGFYISIGMTERLNANGKKEKTHGIFISRLVPGGLAESTNLLAVNDEILEVNGIAIGRDKRLDQVRDMMVANSTNLIITTRPARPANQVNQLNRQLQRLLSNSNNHPIRDRIASTQSNSSDLAEDYIRHHMQ